jgi:hypothetical protein
MTCQGVFTLASFVPLSWANTQSTVAKVMPALTPWPGNPY